MQTYLCLATRLVSLVAILLAAEFGTAVAQQNTSRATAVRKAIVVGVDRYQPASGLSRLWGADNDARKMKAMLTDAEWDVVLMTSDSDGPSMPTRGNFLMRLEEIAASGGFETLLVYFSGHGITAGEEAVLMMADSEKRYPEDTGVPLSMLQRRLQRSKVPMLILMIDACKSGADIFAEKFVASLNAEATKIQCAVYTAVSGQELAREQKVTIKSSKFQQVAGVPELNEVHGAWTLGLLLSKYASRQPNGSLRPLAHKTEPIDQISFNEGADCAADFLKSEGFGQSPAKVEHKVAGDAPMAVAREIGPSPIQAKYLVTTFSAARDAELPHTVKRGATFDPGQGKIVDAVVADTLAYPGREQVYQVRYQISSGEWGGVFIQGRPKPGKSFRIEDWSALSIWLRGDQARHPSQVKVEVKAPRWGQRRTYITGVTTTWKEFIVPLADLEDFGTWENPWFEVVVVLDLDPPSPGIVFVDDPAFLKRSSSK